MRTCGVGRVVGSWLVETVGWPVVGDLVAGWLVVGDFVVGWLVQTVGWLVVGRLVQTALSVCCASILVL